MAFVNGLFHGLDFSVLGQFTAPSVPVFVQVLVTLTGCSSLEHSFPGCVGGSSEQPRSRGASRSALPTTETAAAVIDDAACKGAGQRSPCHP
jgi:hypothetical protein